jgi:hypothetical protein
VCVGLNAVIYLRQIALSQVPIKINQLGQSVDEEYFILVCFILTDSG